MATSIVINGKETSIPGVYSSIKSGIQNPIAPTSYGNICIIDTGMGSGFAGGAGINGSQSSGKDSIYFLSNAAAYETFTKGGVYWDLSNLLFAPAGNNNSIKGTSGVYFVKAATTTAAVKQITLSTQGIAFKTKNEGIACNAVYAGGNLSAGYALKVFASTVNPGKYFISFYTSTYRGDDVLPAAYTAHGSSMYMQSKVNLLNGISDTKAVPTILCSSADFGSIAELVTWLDGSNDFNALFSYSLSLSMPDNTYADSIGPSLTPSAVPITPAEVTALNGYQSFMGATEVYSSASYDAVLSQINEMDNTFFIAPDFAENALSIYNTKLLYHINNVAKFEKFLYIGGGFSKGKFKGDSQSSINIATAYDSDRVQVIHGGYKENVSFSRTPLARSSFYAAVKMLGRVSGLVPYNSCTYKRIRVDGLIHNLSQDEQEMAIKAGVSYFINDPQLGFCIAHDSNTLQKNTYLINEDASSYSHTEKRILAQISKLVVVEAKKAFYGREEGANRFNASSEDLIAWTRSFLDRYKVSDKADNYLLRVGKITVVTEQDNARIDYESVPNGPINKMLFTNIILSA